MFKRLASNTGLKLDFKDFFKKRATNPYFFKLAKWIWFLINYTSYESLHHSKCIDNKMSKGNMSYSTICYKPRTEMTKRHWIVCVK